MVNGSDEKLFCWIKSPVLLLSWIIYTRSELVVPKQTKIMSTTSWDREHQDFVLCFNHLHEVIVSLFEPVNRNLLQVVMFFILNRFNTVIEKSCNLLHIK